MHVMVRRQRSRHRVLQLDVSRHGRGIRTSPDDSESSTTSESGLSDFESDEPGTDNEEDGPGQVTTTDTTRSKGELMRTAARDAMGQERIEGNDIPTVRLRTLAELQLLMDQGTDGIVKRGDRFQRKADVLLRFTKLAHVLQL
eukprot:gb/GECG01010032.1/.p1 GENE.gb/GECG01010032.1/~~gb/GECG01010032.1/.p1  ORF type:complete len:143 (+),score=18.11 gb/GECG01010032.1/:1-429(+)